VGSVNKIIGPEDGGARRAVALTLRIAVALLVGAFVLVPAFMSLPRHGPPPLPTTARTAPPRSCIEGACEEAARCIQAVVKHIVLRLPAAPLLLLALLLVAALSIQQSRERIARQDWWWPPGRRRAFLQVFLI
jgi:hypothetical protein